MADLDKIELKKNQIKDYASLLKQLTKSIGVVDSFSANYKIGEASKEKFKNIYTCTLLNGAFEKELKSEINEKKKEITKCKELYGPYNSFFTDVITKVNKLIKDCSYQTALEVLDEVDFDCVDEDLFDQVNILVDRYKLFIMFSIYDDGHYNNTFFDNLYNHLSDLSLTDDLTGKEPDYLRFLIKGTTMMDSMLVFMKEYDKNSQSDKLSLDELQSRELAYESDLVLLDKNYKSHKDYLDDQLKKLNDYLDKLIDKEFNKDNNLKECLLLYDYLHSEVLCVKTDNPAFNGTRDELITGYLYEQEKYDEAQPFFEKLGTYQKKGTKTNTPKTDGQIKKEVESIIHSYKLHDITNKKPESLGLDSYYQINGQILGVPLMFDFFVNCKDFVLESISKYLESEELFKRVLKCFENQLYFSEYLMFLRVLLNNRSQIYKVFDPIDAAQAAMKNLKDKKACIAAVCYFGTTAYDCLNIRDDVVKFAKTYFSNPDLYIAAKRSNNNVIKDFVNKIYGDEFLPDNWNSNKSIVLEYAFGTYGEFAPRFNPPKPVETTSYSSSKTTSYSSSKPKNSYKTNRPKRGVSKGLMTAGIIFLFIWPIVGFILIIASIAKGDK